MDCFEDFVPVVLLCLLAFFKIHLCFHHKCFHGAFHLLSSFPVFSFRSVEMGSSVECGPSSVMPGWEKKKWGEGEAGGETTKVTKILIGHFFFPPIFCRNQKLFFYEFVKKKIIWNVSKKKVFKYDKKLSEKNGLKNSIWVEGDWLSSYGCVKKIVGPWSSTRVLPYSFR